MFVHISLHNYVFSGSIHWLKACVNKLKKMKEESWRNPNADLPQDAILLRFFQFSEQLISLIIMTSPDFNSVQVKIEEYDEDLKRASNDGPYHSIYKVSHAAKGITKYD